MTHQSKTENLDWYVMCYLEYGNKEYAGDFIFLSEDAKLRELLNVKPKCKTEDKANATEAICIVTI